MNKKSVKNILISIISIIFIGCGESGTESNLDDTKLSGVAVDGYISGATVFLDLNNNNLKDISEPSSITKDDGTFSLSISTDIKNDSNYNNANIVIYGGTDIDTQKSYTGQLKALVKDKNKVNVTPLTTQVSTLLKDDENITSEDIERAKAKVRKAYNLSDTIDVDSDPIALLKSDPTNINRKNFLAANIALHKAVDTLMIASKLDDSSKTTQELTTEIFEALALGVEVADDNSSIEEILSKAEVKNKLNVKASGIVDTAIQVSLETKKAFGEFDSSASSISDEITKAQLKSEWVKNQFEQVFNDREFDFNVTSDNMANELNITIPCNIDISTLELQNKASIYSQS